MRWLLAASALMVMACGFDPDPYRELTIDDSVVVYSYELAEGECSTGKHVFLDKERYCLALGDDVLNGRCAVSQRANLRSVQCSNKNAQL